MAGLGRRGTHDRAPWRTAPARSRHGGRLRRRGRRHLRAANEFGVPSGLKAGERAAEVRWTLWCGVIAGPVLIVMLLMQWLWREDYDLGTDPISSLSLGPCGWVQILTFTVVGLLVGLFGFGARRIHREYRALDRMLRFAGALLIVTGAGLVGEGVFVVDPVGWHCALHDLSTGVAMMAALLAVAAWAAVRRRAKQRVRAVPGALTVAVCTALALSPQAETIALRQPVVIVLTAAWLTRHARRLLL